MAEGAWVYTGPSLLLLAAADYPPASPTACLPSLAAAALSEQTRVRLLEQLFIWWNPFCLDEAVTTVWLLSWGRGEGRQWQRHNGQTPMWCLSRVIAQLNRWEGLIFRVNKERKMVVKCCILINCCIPINCAHTFVFFGHKLFMFNLHVYTHERRQKSKVFFKSFSLIPHVMLHNR